MQEVNINDLMDELSPMLFYESNVFNSKDYIYELKFDGIRCFAYLFIDKTVLVNKRKKDVSLTYPELSDIHLNSKIECILDGEIVVMDKGKPNFYMVQKRSLLVNKLKIKLYSKKIPVTFIVYDILYIDGKLLVDLDLMKRKEILFENVKENSNLVISRHIDEKGKDFFELAKNENLEGIVAKEKSSKYYPGKRSRVWLKMKVYQEEDLVICAYTPSDYGMKDIIFGKYDSNNKLYRVATVMSNKDKDIIIAYAKKHPSEPLFDLNSDNIIWMKPYLVGRVKYMMKTNSGGLRQAVFIGLRDDKVASDLLN